MRTITEFSGFQLAQAIKTSAELTAAGKTADELPQAMGEAFKMEGDKLQLFLQAVETAKTRPDNLKRVVVLTLNEGEKAPQGAVEKDGKYYLNEYFYVPQPKGQKRGGKPGFEGKGKGRGGKGGKGRGGRGPRREGGAGKPGEAREARGGGKDGDKGRRPVPKAKGELPKPLAKPTT